MIFLSTDIHAIVIFAVWMPHVWADFRQRVGCLAWVSSRTGANSGISNLSSSFKLPIVSSMHAQHILHLAFLAGHWIYNSLSAHYYSVASKVIFLGLSVTTLSFCVIARMQWLKGRSHRCNIFNVSMIEAHRYDELERYGVKVHLSTHPLTIVVSSILVPFFSVIEYAHMHIVYIWCIQITV